MLFSTAPLRFSVGELSAAVGKWSRIATFGAKSKDGAEMVFDASTLGQMVDNAAARGDKIAICQDHLSAFVAQTGQPAPALGFFTALAVVASGRVVKAWGGQPEPSALEDGLYAMLGEITPLGHDPLRGLANYAALSPMFSNKAADEAGHEIGFALYDVAATNTPFQSGTEIQFHKGIVMAQVSRDELLEAARALGGDSERRIKQIDPGDFNTDGLTPEKAVRKILRYLGEHGMSNATGAMRPSTKMGAQMDDEMMKRFGFEPDDDDDKKKEKMAKYFSDHDAMAKKFADAESAAGKAVMDAKDGDEAKKMSAKLAALEASNAALMSRFAAVEAAEQARAKAAEAEQTRAVEALADAAVAGGYPKEARPALVTFARADFDAAKALAAPHLKGAPAHLFGRLTQAGGPIGAGDSNRAASGPKPITMSQTVLGTAFAPDEHFADAISALAASKDPADVAKIDAQLSTAERPQMWCRQVVAERIIRKERPELVDQAARYALGLGVSA
jgi:hypothetical protein